MAKRLTDTNKWDKAWFRKMNPVDKCIWMFLCDRCDHAGLWDIDEDAFRYYVGIELSIDQVLFTFRDHVEKVGDKLQIMDFIPFQYGHLNPENRVHKSVLDKLEKLKIKTLISPFQGAKDKDKDKAKDKDPKFLTAKDLAESLSLIDRSKFAKDYPDPDWVARQVELCFEHFTAEPSETPRTQGKWMQKLKSWLESGWQKKLLHAANKPRVVPSTGGWNDGF